LGTQIKVTVHKMFEKVARRWEYRVLEMGDKTATESEAIQRGTRLIRGKRKLQGV